MLDLTLRVSTDFKYLEVSYNSDKPEQVQISMATGNKMLVDKILKIIMDQKISVKYKEIEAIDYAIKTLKKAHRKNISCLAIKIDSLI